MLPSWRIYLQSQRRSPSTLRSYTSNVTAFVNWCELHQVPVQLDRRTVARHIADVLAAGAEPTSAKIRYNALRRFSWWLADEGEIDHDDLLGTRPPRVPVKVVEPLSDDELRRLLATCSTRSFTDLRDLAVLRLALETGMRAGELLALRVDDVDIVAGTAVVRTSKTGSGRMVPFSPTVARALDRYIRARHGHPLAAGGKLFLGRRGQDLGYAGLRKVLGERAARAGVQNFHPHRLRHTAATRWLARGGSERGLQSVGGWRDPTMMRRYAAWAAEAQAAEEARGLGLDDL
jgi:integrase/recombinase XerD